MTKRITVTLTEDQKQYLLGLLMVDEHELEQLEEQSGSVEKALAFTRRVKNLLLKAKVS